MKALVGGLVAVLIVSIVLATIGHFTAARLVSNFGTLLWLVLILLWVVFKDSKRRWPGVKPFDRFARIITFYRD